MRGAAGRFLSNESGPFAQFVKYGAVGVMATCVQLCVFYLLAATWFPCLTPDDSAVTLLGLPSRSFTGAEPWHASRWFLAAAATSFGFVAANVFCWLMNRAFVFRPGRFRWYVEFGMFFGASASAMAVALVVQSALIRWCGVTTSFAAVVEIAVSFMVNFAMRKFLIFRG